MVIDAMLKAFLFIFLGGGAGSVLRYVAGRAAAHVLPASFPWGTFAVNVLGSFAAGLLIGWLATRQSASDSALYLLLMTGFLGGFTTFSAFSVETISLASRNHAVATAYVIATLALTLAAATAGLSVARHCIPVAAP